MIRFVDPTEAVVAAGWLRSAGEPVELADYYLCSLNWLYILAIGGFGLDLAEEQSRILLAAPPRREQPSEEDLAHYRRIERGRRRAVWITLLLGYPPFLVLALASRWLVPHGPPWSARANGE